MQRLGRLKTTPKKPSQTMMTTKRRELAASVKQLSKRRLKRKRRQLNLWTSKTTLRVLTTVTRSYTRSGYALGLRNASRHESKRQNAVAQRSKTMRLKKSASNPTLPSQTSNYMEISKSQAIYSQLCSTTRRLEWNGYGSSTRKMWVVLWATRWAWARQFKLFRSSLVCIIRKSSLSPLLWFARLL